jgi:hypothetical protein
VGGRATDIRPCALSVVAALVEKYHGYGSMGASATYAWAVYEDDQPVAAFSWQPPPVGAATSVCPEAPGGVLSLSRMVAVPRSERRLKHISKPLMVQMKRLIDRGRWPVLVTFSDEGQGHNGYVYQCSGWQKTSRAERRYWLNERGERASSYSNGRTGGRNLIPGGVTTIQRWEHWICEKGRALEWMKAAGWERRPIPNRKWKSGNQAHRWESVDATDSRQAPILVP